MSIRIQFRVQKVFQNGVFFGAFSSALSAQLLDASGRPPKTRSAALADWSIAQALTGRVPHLSKYDSRRMAFFSEGAILREECAAMQRGERINWKHPRVVD